MAIVVTRARGGSRDLFRKYRVLVDGIEVGRIGQGETLSHDVADGEHTVQLKIDWGTSASYRCMLGSGESAYFACAPGGGAPLDAAIAGRGAYIDLQRAAGPVEVRDLPSPLRSRPLAGVTIAFFGGGALVIGAAIWQMTGVAKQADAIVMAIGLVVTIAATIAFKLGARRANRARKPSSRL